MTASRFSVKMNQSAFRSSVIAELVAAGYDDLELEMRYIGAVRASHWLHPALHPNENLATELGVWPLGIFRQADVLAFRESELGPALAGPGDGALTVAPELAGP